jgi:hypothetical protein
MVAGDARAVALVRVGVTGLGVVGRRRHVLGHLLAHVDRPRIVTGAFDARVE